jgi:hypothetical protein
MRETPSKAAGCTGTSPQPVSPLSLPDRAIRYRLLGEHKILCRGKEPNERLGKRQDVVQWMLEL